MCVDVAAHVVDLPKEKSVAVVVIRVLTTAVGFETAEIDVTPTPHCPESVVPQQAILELFA
jgi:hypothetical protein